MLTFSRVLSLTAYPLLTWSNSRSAEGRPMPSLDEYFPNLDNLFEPTLEEELVTLVGYTRRASAALALGRADHWEAFWSDQHYAKKQRLKECVCIQKL